MYIWVSTKCNLSYASYFSDKSAPQGDAKTVTQAMVTALRQANPDLQILLSFGGWNLDNISRDVKDASGKIIDTIHGCEYKCDGTGNPLTFLWTVYQCTPYSDKQSPVYPSDFCTDANAVADKIIGLVDGVDIDFENTKVYNDPSDNRREDALKYIVELTKALRSKRQSLIITHSRMW
jgi:GH18 family chitinase